MLLCFFALAQQINHKSPRDLLRAMVVAVGMVSGFNEAYHLALISGSEHRKAHWEVPERNLAANP